MVIRPASPIRCSKPRAASWPRSRPSRETASGHLPAQHPPRSGFPLRPGGTAHRPQPKKRANRPPAAALRDLSGGVIAGWIRPSNHDLCLAHAARRDKREQGGRIAEREPHAAMRRRRAEAGMVRAVNGVAARTKENRMRHPGIVPLPRIMHPLHTKRSVGTGWRRIFGGAGRDAPAVAHVTIDCDAHDLRWLVNCDKNIGNRCLAWLDGRGRRISLWDRRIGASRRTR